MKPEPQVVTEGDWAKFCCRVIGNPRPRLMWILNGRTIGPVSNQLKALLCLHLSHSKTCICCLAGFRDVFPNLL